MQIRLACIKDTDITAEITHQTIKTIYPAYYPAGAVKFFIEHHSAENIKNDIVNHNVYLLEDNDTVIGTVTVKKNTVNRLFVLPQFQGRGYGSALLDFAEKLIFEAYKTVQTDASLSAKKMYLARGYSGIEYNIIKTDNGHFLCYDVMQKKRSL